MKPNQTLPRYQIPYHPLNNGSTSTSVSARCLNFQRQWRRCMALTLISMLLVFCYWTFQSNGASPFLLERAIASEEPTLISEEVSIEPSTAVDVPSEVQKSTILANPSEESSSNPANKRKSNDALPMSVTPDSAKFSVPKQQKDLPECPDKPPNLVGPIPVWLDGPEMSKIEKLYSHLGNGGHGWPEECQARNRVAIIIPYRDRETHLRIFLHNIHAFLHKQQLDYAIFVIEQKAEQTFNRGKLMNVGFVEANRLYGWECFIFHDVDLLPEDDRNLYTCPQQPRHMSVAVDKFNYKLPYQSLFGGAEALTRKQMEKMNGFSNDYWGWGGEDDDISARLTFAGFSISRYPTTIARYKMVKHEKEQLNPVNDCRHALMKKTKQRWKRDGIANLNYRVLSTEYHRLYTNITVDLLEVESRRALSEEHIKKGC